MEKSIFRWRGEKQKALWLHRISLSVICFIEAMKQFRIGLDNPLYKDDLEGQYFSRLILANYMCDHVGAADDLEVILHHCLRLAEEFEDKNYTMYAKHMLANLHYMTGKYEMSEILNQEVLELIDDNEHILYLHSKANIASIKNALGELADAEELIRSIIEENPNSLNKKRMLLNHVYFLGSNTIGFSKRFQKNEILRW